MEQCLAISEIQRMILEGQDARTQLAFALTARAFTEVALDYLWEKQEELSPLIKTMSREDDLWTVLGGDAEGAETQVPAAQRGPVLVFTRDVKDSDWERFKYYASRIRRLDLEQLRNCDRVWVHDDVYAALFTTCPTKAIFPNLKRLFVRFGNSRPTNTANYFSHFLHGSITDLAVHIQTDGDSEPIESFLSSAHQHCPNITRFETLLWTSENYSSSIKTLIRGLDHLEALDYDEMPITPDLVYHLGKLPRLSCLKASWVGQILALPYQMPDSMDGLFVHLRQLVFANSSIEKIVGFLEKLRSPLFSLNIHNCTLQTIQTSSVELDRLFRAISSFQLLEDLHITERFRLFTEDPTFYKTTIPKLLYHIYGKLSLRTLHLSMSLAHGISNETLFDMARAWPQLRRLSLRAAVSPIDQDVNVTKNITLEGVMPLLEKCHELEHLELPLNCLPFAPLRVYGKGSMRVKTFTLSECSLQEEHIMQVLRCLAVMFPVATSVEVGYPYGNTGVLRKFNELARSFFGFPGI